MRRVNPRRGGRLAAWAAGLSGAGIALLAGTLATPAAGVTNLYAPQRASEPGNLLSQFAVAPDGSLTALAAAALGSGARDIAIAPEGRFAYATLSFRSGAIERFVSAAAGRMQPAGRIAVDGAPQGILVNPQGTRVYYADASSRSLLWRPIGAGGELGAPASVSVESVIPRFLAMTPDGTNLYVTAARSQGAPQLLQFAVDPDTGALTARSPASMDWPAGARTPSDIARMTVSPDGEHLYAASGEQATGIAHFAIGASGTLAAGSIVGVPADSSGGPTTPISPSGAFLWAPSSLLATGRIDQFAIAGGGALSALSPAASPYTGSVAPADDAVAGPDGRTLYLGQAANVGEWAIAPAGTVSLRADHPAAGGSSSAAGLVLAPSQAPTASFSAAPAPAGEATTFDARASADPDGTVARYDWSFDEGATPIGGGATPSHVYPTQGAHKVTLTVTDADGTSTSQLWTGSAMLRNGGPSATVTHQVAIPAAAATPPPGSPQPPATTAGVAPPATPSPRPRPVKRRSVTVAAKSGKVRVKVPGSKVYVDVSQLRSIPLGSRIDARKGRVRVRAEVDSGRGRTQSSLFYAGIFKVSQTGGARPTLVAKLVGGSFADCASGPAIRNTNGRRLSAPYARLALGASFAVGRPFAFVAKKSKKSKRGKRRSRRSKRTVRRLWGHGKGSFRTSGRRSSATVRGTWWLVEDRCDGTLTRVKRGRVDVRDKRRKKTIRLRAGKSTRSRYLAKAP